MAGKGIPFRSRHTLEWRLVLVDPHLLRRAQRRLGASGPSDAIDLALQLVADPPLATADPVHGPVPVH